MGCLFKTVPQSWTTSSWIWLNESWTLIFTSYCSLCLPFRCAFWFSYVGGVLVFFLELMLFADFLMVSFGFHALWISERSFLLFLKLSLFVVSFVLYNCALWFRRTHGSVKTSSLKEKAMEVMAVLIQVTRVPWNYIQPVDPYLGDEQKNLKKTFPWQIFGSSETYNCMS